MLATPDGGRLPSAPSLVYETKMDGFRCCYRVAPDGTTVLTSRNGRDFTLEFAELTGVLTAALDGQAAVLDGEIVVYDEHGRPDFALMQERRGRYQRQRSSRGHKEALNIDLKHQKTEGSPVPWHPGALKYFAEQGVKM